MLGDVRGQAIVFFTMVVAAAEVVVGLGIIVSIFRRRKAITAEEASLLKG
jgi:NADH-quinone oxidoreductase subunit K